MSDIILIGMLREFFRVENMPTDRLTPQDMAAMRAAVRYLADNVTDEMCDAAEADNLRYMVGAGAIRAALLKAAGEGE